MTLIAIFLPWLSFILRGKILSGIICLILQISLIGWIPATIWAIVSINDSKNKKRMNKMEKNILKAQSITK